MSAQIHAHPAMLDGIEAAMARAASLGMVAIIRGNGVLFAKPMKQSDVDWQAAQIGSDLAEAA